MIDYILIGFLALCFLLNAVASIWETKMKCKTQERHTTVILLLYQELKRHNDLAYGERNEGNNQ